MPNVSASRRIFSYPLDPFTHFENRNSNLAFGRAVAALGWDQEDWR